MILISKAKWDWNLLFDQEISNDLQNINVAFVRIVKAWHIDEGNILVRKGEPMVLDSLSARLEAFSNSEL